ncbi:hypothetical protein BABA_11011 [Neobacillus bataviensis LMG 21833]|uniref:DUF4832 domain-containing protein n=1 Tax=Neobacillus bataviensis LMG 21833 TaxID=1117379 RepID=K6DLP3_9BACI|nr:DUF4832 domain-containing protein [Neobacillus bataviensis]EKN69239.1 hypothetical protein BABA_11011 [Neobacillus bataviensis LMG 21833]
MKKLILILIAVILLIIVAFTVSKRSRQVTFQPERAVNNVIVNPYTGFAPPADGGPYTQPHSLVYANFTWRDLEPKKGHIDFAGIEKKYRLDYWKEKNIKLIFRVVMDTPGDKKHMDIPDWLYKEINEEGTWYDHKWGKGFSPNYSNKKLIAYHNNLIKKLAEQYNNDSEIAFIEIGSIGHWAEFHTLQQDGIYIPFPKLPVVETYVKQYIKYFDKKILLMRRPHQIAIDNKMGLFNDMFGKKPDTVDEFWKWVTKGYTFWLTNEKNPSMEGFWKYAPTGGEFAPTHYWEDYFSSAHFSNTMEQLELTHVSWLGPSSPADYPMNGEMQKRMNQFMNKMGYHFCLLNETHPESVTAGTTFRLSMEWENTGVAPFYFDWPLEISLADQKGEIVYKQQLKADIRKWLPGKHQISEDISLPTKLNSGKYNMLVTILDPATGKPGIQFEMAGRRDDGRYTLGEIMVK